jgi:GNAT superfamily N-acetyltransferase
VIQFERFEAERAGEVLGEEYVELYLATRAEPPYNSGPLYARDRFLDRTAKQAAGEGFRLVSARDEGRLVGFAFGFRIPAGRWWGGGPGLTPELERDENFAVIELDLAKEYRGRGYGRLLLEELLEGRREPWAILLSLPSAPAHALYEHLGWDVVGTMQPFPDAEVADVMAVRLPG